MIPTEKDTMVLSVNGKPRYLWYCKGHAHANNIFVSYFLEKDPFHRHGLIIASVQEDINGEPTIRYV